VSQFEFLSGFIPVSGACMPADWAAESWRDNPCSRSDTCSPYLLLFLVDDSGRNGWRLMNEASIAWAYNPLTLNGNSSLKS
jgi:hypothetical protein